MRKKLVTYFLITLLAFLLSGSGIVLAAPPPQQPPPYSPYPYYPWGWGYIPWRGCPYMSTCRATPGQDSDGDSVPDWVDRCSGTTLQEAVDQYGCPITAPPAPGPDTDNDLVHDDYDWCVGPGDQSTRNVDTAGCPTDGQGEYWYKVPTGDWWYKIARRSGVCLKKLWEDSQNRQYTDLYSGRPYCWLYPGDKVWIPQP